MKKHVEYMFGRAKNHNPNREDAPEYHSVTDGELDADYIWDTEFHWGEWLEADIGTAGEMEAMMGKYMNPDPEVPTMYLYYSTKLFSDIARVLDRPADAAEYGKRAEKVKRMFNRYLIREDGEIKAGRQAPNVRALAFGLCDEEHREAVLRNLVKTIHACGDRLNTGFLATPFLLNVLADNGETELAYRLLEREDAPSWLYNVRRGATTVLEEWCGMDTHVGSFNHYSCGAVCDFLFSRTAGIRPCFETPGYRRFVIEPVPGGSLTHACAVYDSVCGRILSAWEKTPEGMAYRFEIPANTKAEIRLAASGEGAEILCRSGAFKERGDGKVWTELGSGTWTFTVSAV